MLLIDDEIARLESLAPFLLSEAKAALASNVGHAFTMELAEHVPPGLRIRAPDNPNDDRDAPLWPLDLFVGLPLVELRRLANATDGARERLIARFGATFVPRLSRAIRQLAPHDIHYEAGRQTEKETLTVLLDEPAAG